MGALIQFEIGEMPDILLVGKEIRHSMKAMANGNNPIPDFWARCFQDGTFSMLEASGSALYNGAYAGVMIDWDQGYNSFSYVVGMLMKIGADVPPGFVSHTLDATKVAIGWIQGKDASDVSSKAYEYTEQAVYAGGYRCSQMKWCMELFTHPRYTTPDENGNITLDFYIPVECRDATKESVESIMNLVLNGETLENALGFVAFLRDAEFQAEYNPREYGERKWTGAIGGVVGNSIGYLYVRAGTDFPDPWTIWLNAYEFDAGSSAEDAALKEFVWENVNHCSRCHPNWENCGGGERTVFGRKFERLCHSPMVFYTPDAHKLEKIEKLLLRIRQDRDGVQPS